VPHNQICTVSAPLSMPRQRQGLKRKNLKLQGWNLNFFFYKGENRNSPKLQGSKDILTLNNIQFTVTRHFTGILKVHTIPFTWRCTSSYVLYVSGTTYSSFIVCQRCVTEPTLIVTSLFPKTQLYIYMYAWWQTHQILHIRHQ